MKKKSSKISLDKVKKMQKLLDKCNTDIETLSAFNKQLDKIIERRNQLVAFNDNEWLSYYESEIDTKGENYTLLNQDSVYNAIVDSYEQSIKIMKKMMAFL